METALSGLALTNAKRQGEYNRGRENDARLLVTLTLN